MTNKSWKRVAVIGSIMVITGLKSGLGKGYKKITGKEPPENPAEQGVKIKDAILWTIFISIIGGVGKLLFETLITYKWKDDALTPKELAKTT